MLLLADCVRNLEVKEDNRRQTNPASRLRRAQLAHSSMYRHLLRDGFAAAIGSAKSAGVLQSLL